MERTRRNRAAVALALGIVAGFGSARFLNTPGIIADFEFVWRGTRLWLDGVSPYGLTRYQGEPIFGGGPMYYPLPTLWLVSLLAWLPAHIAGGIFFGISTMLAAYALTRDAWWRLYVFASGSFLMAMKMAQFSPLLTFAALVPAAGWLIVMKPSLGVGVFLYRPTWRTAVICIALMLASLTILPGWFGAWLRSGADSGQHVVPALSVYGGPLLLLAALRWRTPEGRLLLGLSLVPQFLFFYDQFLLWLIPRSRRAAAGMAALNLAGMFAWILIFTLHDGTAAGVPQLQTDARPWVMASCYLPALLLVLRQPNEGRVPAWIERWMRVPARFHLTPPGSRRDPTPPHRSAAAGS